MVAERQSDQTIPWAQRSHAERFALAEAIRARYGPWFTAVRLGQIDGRFPYKAIQRAYGPTGPSANTIWHLLRGSTLAAPERRMRGRRGNVPITAAERRAVLAAVRAGASQAVIAQALAGVKPALAGRRVRSRVHQIVAQARAAGELPPDVGRRQAGRARGRG